MRGGACSMSDPPIISACPEVLVLRHGQTEWNAAGRLQGHLDSPLTEIGLRQAQRQNETLLDYDLDGFRFITSPQGRARKTAQLALAGIVAEIETSEELKEINMGQWSGTTRAAIACRAQNAPAGSWRVADLRLDPWPVKPQRSFLSVARDFWSS
jgi:probable phosphoglycerate mutase